MDAKLGELLDEVRGLREKAIHMRELAWNVSDDEVQCGLTMYSEEIDAKVRKIEIEITALREQIAKRDS